MTGYRGEQQLRENISSETWLSIAATAPTGGGN